MIDYAEILNVAPVAQSAVVHLTEFQKEIMKQVEAAQIESKNSALSKELQQQLLEYQTLLAKEHARVEKLINETLQRTLTDLRVEKGLGAILDKGIVVSIDKAADITDEALERIGKITIDFSENGYKILPIYKVNPTDNANDNLEEDIEAQ